MLASLTLLLVPTAAAGSAATDEYATGIAGGGEQVTEDVQRDPNAHARSEGEQLGVVGETSPPQTPLEAAGPVAWITLAAAIAGGVASFALRRRAPGPA